MSAIITREEDDKERDAPTEMFQFWSGNLDISKQGSSITLGWYSALDRYIDRISVSFHGEFKNLTQDCKNSLGHKIKSLIDKEITNNTLHYINDNVPRT